MEDPKVETTMVRFGACLDTDTCKDGWSRKDSQIKYLSLALARAFRQSLGDTYDQDSGNRVDLALKDADEAANAEAEGAKRRAQDAEEEAKRKEAAAQEAAITKEEGKKDPLKSPNQRKKKKQNEIEEKEIRAVQEAEQARKLAEDEKRKRDAAIQMQNFPQNIKSRRNRNAP